MKKYNHKTTGGGPEENALTALLHCLCAHSFTRTLSCLSAAYLLRASLHSCHGKEEGKLFAAHTSPALRAEKRLSNSPRAENGIGTDATDAATMSASEELRKKEERQ